MPSSLRWIFYISVLLLTVCTSPAACFLLVAVPAKLSSRHGRRIGLAATPSSPNEDDFFQDLQTAAEKIQVENTRQQLEQDNVRSFLKRKPRKLPYDQARRWVQANLGADTQEEFDDLVANGNVRTPYIPKQPEKYYTETREWISWEHFLKGIFDDSSPSEIRPATGILD